MPLFRNVKRHTESAPDPTRKIKQPGQRSSRNKSPQKPTPARETRGVDSSSRESLLDNPVVGWLAVIAGPGRGQVLALGYGINEIGRGVEARVRLDFGDDAVELGHHAAIIYSSKTRHFYLQPREEGGRVALDGHSLQGTTELKPGQTLTLGRTELRFTPLCGVDFDWSQGAHTGCDP